MIAKPPFLPIVLGLGTAVLAMFAAVVSPDTPLEWLVRPPIECRDPTPADSAWWRWTWTPTGGGNAIGHTPEAPELRLGRPVADWEGRYSLRIIPTVGRERGETLAVAVDLHVNHAADSGSRALIGHATGDRAWPSYFTFSSDLRGSHRVPLELRLGPYRRDLTFVLGNPRLQVTDVGVLLDVFAIDREAIVGRWVDGGLRAYPHDIHPQGYFCMRRMTYY